MTAKIFGETRSFPSSTAKAPYLRVIRSGSDVVAAGAGDDELGILEQRALSTDTLATVRLPNFGETVRVTVAGAVAQYAELFRAAAGKLDDVPNGERWGYALEAASGDGSQIEALRLPPLAQKSLVEAHTAADTLLAAEMYGSIHTSVGAGGTVTLTLPAAVVGMHARFYVGAAQELRLDPDGTETISLPSTGVPGAAGKYLTANAAGETVELVCCTAGSWAAFGFTGTWTAEA